VPALIAAGRVRAFDNGTRYFLDFGTLAALKQL
jgi:3-deoxy-D-arabino-heptulosonate 7-phosphate (DAHP) synthase